MTVEPGVLQEEGLAVHALGDALLVRAIVACLVSSEQGNGEGTE